MLETLPFEWIGALFGVLCMGLFMFTTAVGAALLTWRMTRPPASQDTLPLDEEGPQTTQMLASVLGYRRTEDGHRMRERWGRPVTYVRDPQRGAQWSTPVETPVLSIEEREGRAGGFQTGASALDTRFYMRLEAPDFAQTLIDPDLVQALLALPQVHIEADGTELRLLDSTLRAHQRACSPHAPESTDGLEQQVRLHDSVCDLLVMLADRLG